MKLLQKGGARFLASSASVLSEKSNWSRACVKLALWPGNRKNLIDMNSTPLIFVGFELTEQVEKHLSDCAQQDKVYFEDPTYLEQIIVDDRRFIGKRAKDGIAVDRLEDVARSVVSLLSRVSKNWRQAADEALVIAVEETASLPENINDTGDLPPEDTFDYSKLVD